MAKVGQAHGFVSFYCTVPSPNMCSSITTEENKRYQKSLALLQSNANEERSQRIGGYKRTLRNSIKTFRIVQSTDVPFKEAHDDICRIFDEHAKMEAKDIGSGIPVLEEGILFNGSVRSGELRVFQFNHRNHHRAICIELRTVDADSDADLYVSTDTKRPSKHSSMWVSDSRGSDLIVIQPNDPSFLVGAYYIGISGVVSESAEMKGLIATENSFTISVHTKMVKSARASEVSTARKRVAALLSERRSNGPLQRERATQAMTRLTEQRMARPATFIARNRLAVCKSQEQATPGQPFRLAQHREIRRTKATKLSWATVLLVCQRASLMARLAGIDTQSGSEKEAEHQRPVLYLGGKSMLPVRELVSLIAMSVPVAHDPIATNGKASATWASQGAAKRYHAEPWGAGLATVDGASNLMTSLSSSAHDGRYTPLCRTIARDMPIGLASAASCAINRLQSPAGPIPTRPPRPATCRAAGTLRRGFSPWHGWRGDSPRRSQLDVCALARHESKFYRIDYLPESLASVSRLSQSTTSEKNFRQSSFDFTPALSLAVPTAFVTLPPINMSSFVDKDLSLDMWMLVSRAQSGIILGSSWPGFKIVLTTEPVYVPDQDSLRPGSIRLVTQCSVAVMFQSISGSDCILDGVVAVGSWTHVCVVIDCANCRTRLFLNGLEAAMEEAVVLRNDFSFGLSLGAKQSTDGESTGLPSFCGQLRSVRLWSEAITSEIRSIARCCSDANEVDLVDMPPVISHLPLDSPSGRLAAEAKSRHAPATLHGGARYTVIGLAVTATDSVDYSRLANCVDRIVAHGADRLVTQRDGLYSLARLHGNSTLSKSAGVVSDLSISHKSSLASTAVSIANDDKRTDVPQPGQYSVFDWLRNVHAMGPVESLPVLSRPSVAGLMKSAVEMRELPLKAPEAYRLYCQAGLSLLKLLAEEVDERGQENLRLLFRSCIASSKELLDGMRPEP